MKTPNRILLVDDNEANLELLAEILADQFTLRSAASGEEALEIAPEFRPDIVLLDIMMPGINGYETCRRLKANPVLGGTKVILVSAKAMTSERVKGYEAGADDYIVKPFDEDELLAKLKVFLRLKNVEEVDRVKSDLIMLLNHETRTPLNGLITPLQMLVGGMEMDDDQQKEMIEIAYRSARRLVELMEKALLYMSLRSGSREIRRENCLLGETIREVLGDFSEEAADKGMEFEILANAGLEVACEKPLLQRALKSLLDNAIHHSPEGGTVAISVQAREGNCELSIQDQGPGVAPAVLPHLFEPFHSQDIMRHSRGQKLSLPLVREIALKHGGRIELDNRPGHGATFTLIFPIQAPRPDQGQAARIPDRDVVLS